MKNRNSIMLVMLLFTLLLSSCGASRGVDAVKKLTTQINEDLSDGKIIEDDANKEKLDVSKETKATASTKTEPDTSKRYAFKIEKPEYSYPDSGFRLIGETAQMRDGYHGLTILSVEDVTEEVKKLGELYNHGIKVTYKFDTYKYNTKWYKQEYDPLYIKSSDGSMQFGFKNLLCFDSLAAPLGKSTIKVTTFEVDSLENIILYYNFKAPTGFEYLHEFHVNAGDKFDNAQYPGLSDVKDSHGLGDKVMIDDKAYELAINSVIVDKSIARDVDVDGKPLPEFANRKFITVNYSYEALLDIEKMYKSKSDIRLFDSKGVSGSVKSIETSLKRPSNVSNPIKIPKGTVVTNTVTFEVLNESDRVQIVQVGLTEDYVFDIKGLK